MKIADVFFQAQLDDGKLQVDAKKSGDKAGATMGGQISTSLGKTAFLGFGAKAGAAAFGLLEHAVGGVTDRIGEFVTKAREEEVVNARLDQALKANVAGWNGNRTAIDEYIKRQTDLGFTVAETTASLAQLVAATGNVSKAQTFQAAAMDLARLKGISLADATDALTKVEGGSYRILKSLGIQLAKHATQTEALAAVQKIAAGQAAVYAETSAGAQDKFNAKLDETEAKIGQHILPLLTSLTNAMSTAFDIIDNTAHADALVQQTKDFAALNLPVQEYRNALAGVLEQYKLLANDPGATQQQKDDILAVMVVLQEQINLEKGAIPILNDMGSAAYGAFSTIKTGATDAEIAAAKVETFRQELIYAKIAADRATPAIHAFFDQFDVAIGKGNIAQDTINLRAANQAVDDAREARDKFAKDTSKWKAANDLLTVSIGNVASVSQRLRDDEVKLFLTKPDAKTHAALLTYFSGIGLGVRNLTGDLKLAWDALFGKDTGLLSPRDYSVNFTLHTGKGLPKGFASGGFVPYGMPFIGNERGAELFTPTKGGYDVTPAGPTRALLAAAAPTYNTTINYPNPSRAPEDFGRTLRRLTALGIGS